MDDTPILDLALDHRLLSDREQADLGKRIQAGNHAPAGHPAVADGQRALAALVSANVRLAVSRAHRHVERRRPLHSLLPAALDGLLAAATRFDPSRGYRFSTYATVAIDRRLHDACNQDLRYRQHVAPAPDIADIAAAHQPSDPSPEEHIVASYAQAAARRQVSALLDRLDPADRQFLRLRWGLDGAGVRPLADVADQLGMTVTEAAHTEARLHTVTAAQVGRPDRQLVTAC